MISLRLVHPFSKYWHIVQLSRSHTVSLLTVFIIINYSFVLKLTDQVQFLHTFLTLLHELFRQFLVHVKDTFSNFNIAG